MRGLKGIAVFAVCGIILFGMMAMVPPTQAATTLRFAHSESTTNIRHEAALYFAERLEKLTNGDLKVEVYPSGQMGTHTQCQEMVATGALDIYPTTAGLVSVFDDNRTQELIELPTCLTTMRKPMLSWIPISWPKYTSPAGKGYPLSGHMG